MAINNALALAVKPPEVDFTRNMMIASQLRAADTQNELARLQLGQMQDDRNSLAAFRAADAQGDPNAHKNLRPEMQAQVIQTRNALQAGERARYDHNVLQNSRDAMEVLAIPAGPERDRAWKEKLAKARDEGRINPQAFDRLTSMPVNDLILRQAVMAGMTLEQFIGQQNREQDRAEDRQTLGAVAGMFGGGGAAPAQQARSEPRGIRNNNPLNIEAGAFTQGMPGYAGSDGRFARFGTQEQGLAAADRLLQSYSGRGINTVSGVINRWAPASDNNPVSAYSAHVANALGIKPTDTIDLNDAATRQKVISAMAEFENGKPLVNSAVTTPGAAPDPNARIPGLSIGGVPSNVAIPRLMAAAATARSEGTRNVMMELLKTSLSESRATDEQREYYGSYVPQQIAAGKKVDGIEDFTTWKRKNKESGRTTVSIDQRGETKLQEELSKGVGKWVNELADDGVKAADEVNLVGRLGSLLEKSGTGSSVAFTNWVREQTGIRLGPKADAAEAANALINYLKPRMRVPGTGASSDRDLEAFARSIPSLLSTPDGRRIIIETLGGTAMARQARGDIALRVQMGEITPRQGLDEIRKLGDPYKTFRDWQGQRGGQGGVQTKVPEPPKVGDIVGDHRFQGGDPADPNSWERVGQ